MLELEDRPQQFADCCLSLSNKLFTKLSELIQEAQSETKIPLTIFSIGCGTGLFESLLQARLSQECYTIKIHAVEVVTAITRYLPIERVHRVHGTWDLCHDATTADILFFVYPRQARLVMEYMKLCHQTSAVFWLGPRTDWEEQRLIMSEAAKYGPPNIIEQAGLPPFELLGVFYNVHMTRNLCMGKHSANAYLPSDEDLADI